MARGWWSAKIHRTWTYLHAGVSVAERSELASWLNPAQVALFDAMPAGDRRHGLDVVADLRRSGATDVDLLVAGLLAWVFRIKGEVPRAIVFGLLFYFITIYKNQHLVEKIYILRLRNE